MDAPPHEATVLVVDDDEDIRTVFRHGLGHLGYRVITAATGVEGLRSAQEEHPDVVLMDLSIRGADAWEVVRCLKAAEETRDIPIVLVTGHTDLDRRAKAEGCAAYLAKPVRLEVLRTVVDKLVRRR